MSLVEPQEHMGRIESATTRRLLILAALVVLLAVVAESSPRPAGAAISRNAFEDCLLDRANSVRAAAGVGELQMAHDLVPQVRDWSESMRFDGFAHMPDSLRQDILPDSWTAWAENIAMHSNDDMVNCGTIHSMWMNSPGHRANLLDPGFRFVAMGTYVDGSGWWATQLFFDASGYPATCNGTFCDDDGSTFEPAIEDIAAAGITNGCNPPAYDRFCPDQYINRGQMAAFLARALDLPPGSADFADTNGSTYEAPIQAIAAAGITMGCNPPANTHFCSDDYVDRGQMAAFLTRALDLPASNAVDFADDDQSMFESDIESIAAAGITLGCNPPSNTRFCPNDYVTRGQMAAFLARALDL